MNDDKHEAKICPRCGGRFVCKANRIHRCDCMGVCLSPETVEYIKHLYDECLCIVCLEAVEGAVRGRSANAPEQR